MIPFSVPMFMVLTCTDGGGSWEIAGLVGTQAAADELVQELYTKDEEIPSAIIGAILPRIERYCVVVNLGDSMVYDCRRLL